MSPARRSSGFQIVKATGDNKQALNNFRSGDLDNANKFAFVRLSLTVGVAGKLIGIKSRYNPADAYNLAAVVQIIRSSAMPLSP